MASLELVSQWAKSAKKQSEGVRFLQCHIVKNTLLLTDFAYWACFLGRYFLPSKKG